MAISVSWRRQTQRMQPRLTATMLTTTQCCFDDYRRAESVQVPPVYEEVLVEKVAPRPDQRAWGRHRFAYLAQRSDDRIRVDVRINRPSEAHGLGRTRRA
jgi:hypothetical protein